MAKEKLKDTPVEQDSSEYAALKLDAKAFCEYLKKIRPFISQEETRYYPNGVLMAYTDGKLTLVATNGHIMQKRVIKIAPETEGKNFSLICPKETIDNLIMILSQTHFEEIYDELDEEADGQREVHRYNHVNLKVLDTENRKQGKVSFDLLDSEIISKTIDGAFPDYTKMIPEQNVGLETGFNAEYIKYILSAFGSKGVNIFVSAIEGSNKGPHVFTNNKNNPDTYNSDLMCVVMPLST